MITITGKYAMILVGYFKTAVLANKIPRRKQRGIGGAQNSSS
jgi:hypothetical protein